MSRFWVVLSGENPPLAAAELRAAVGTLHGSMLPEPPPGERTIAIHLGDRSTAQRLAERLALSHRILEPWAETDATAIEARFAREAAAGGSIAIRPHGHLRGDVLAPAAHRWATAYKRAGGAIDLEHPDRMFFAEFSQTGDAFVAEQIATIPRSAFDRRRLPRLPFRRPVTLPPRRARAAANLAGIGPGSTVVDPFLGTGALLLEASLLGARVYGVDRDPAMVRGALTNLAAFDREPTALRVGDAGDVPPEFGPERWDALVTDPPYGRASGSGGEPPERLVARVLPRWAERLAPGARAVVLLPSDLSPAGLLGPGWVLDLAIPDRVHRSLTRIFCVFRRAGDA